MPRQSVSEYFRPDSRPIHEPAVCWQRGYRVMRWSYRELWRAATDFAWHIRSQGLGKGERVLIWGENSGEWVAAFLGCLFSGAVAVPIDAVGEKGFARRVAQQAGVRLAVIGRDLPELELPVATITLEELECCKRDPMSPPFSFEPSGRGDPIEIVFTSGTTAEPRGVILTHGNLLANLEPIEREINRYRRYERLVHPLRLLDLLPLSHVFGQLLGIFIPQILGATSVFVNTLNPSDVISKIHSERVSVLVTVPRLVESLKDQIERDFQARGQGEKFRRNFQKASGESVPRRWWRFQSIHRRFGWKFWAIISGGAALPAETERFWGRLGYAVIQGYGLTETTSLISVNHPFHLGHGSIGRALPGLEVALADDGEILVRGENVAPGYWAETPTAPVRDQDGWFHTGDIGERDGAGNLYFKGRSKNVIVTSEGLNVYPQDLEAEVRKEPGVRDCVVVGLNRGGNAQPCAVLLLRDPGAQAEREAAKIMDRANLRLAPFQHMRHCMVWADTDFPRTPTQKPLLGEIARSAETYFNRQAAQPNELLAPSTLQDLLARVTRSGSGPAARAAKLQLTSIERVELLAAFEDRYQMDVSENEFMKAESLQDLENILELPAAHAPVSHYPRWAQRWPVRIIRAILLNLLARPAMLLLGWPRIIGRENLRGSNGPVLLVANHIAFFDPAYVLEALPKRFRRKLAIAMDGELLESMRNPPAGRGFFASLVDRAAYWLVVAIFNVFPLPLQTGFRKSFAFAGELIDRGWSVLIFPEGARTRDGHMGPFRAGIGLLAAQLRVPVVPLRLDGIFELKALGKKWARPGRIQVSIAAPVGFRASDRAEEIARDLERRVAGLSGASGSGDHS